MAWRRGPTGVEEQGMRAIGVSQEPERPDRLPEVRAKGYRQRVTRAKRDGRLGVGACW